LGLMSKRIANEESQYLRKNEFLLAQFICIMLAESLAHPFIFRVLLFAYLSNIAVFGKQLILTVVFYVCDFRTNVKSILNDWQEQPVAQQHFGPLLIPPIRLLQTDKVLHESIEDVE